MERIAEQRAVVIGGGIAGLLAARILSKYYDKVIIIEKDAYPLQIGPRNGTPQSNHTHVLLVKGKKILLELFPNIEKKLKLKGAHTLDLLNDVRYYVGTGYSMNFKSGITTIACTRQLLEHEIKNEIIENFANVIIREKTMAKGLVIEKSTEKEMSICNGLTTVCLNTNSEEIISADLVVDTSGRGSKAAKWLEELGFGKPSETIIRSFIGYSTYRYKPIIQKISHNQPTLHKIIPTIVFTNPPRNRRMGVIYPIEDSAWLIGVLSIGGLFPPTDQNGFLKYTKELETIDMYNTIKDFEFDNQLYGYRTIGSRQYHYEKMKSWPENFIAFGDSVSSFNPIYAQGITVACIGALTLDKALKQYRRNRPLNRSKSRFALTFQKRISRINKLPWLLGTGEDFQWSTTEGIRPNLVTRLLQKYSHRVLLLTPKSKIATKSFFQVIHMIKPPIIIFHPLILFHVLFERIKEYKVEKNKFV